MELFKEHGADPAARAAINLFADRRFDVDDFLSELAQPFIGLAFFIERLLKKFGRVFFAEHVGKGAHGAVAGDFVVLNLFARPR